MSIITISRGSYSKGKEVAENVAKRLGYECISREVILDASDRYHIPEIKLIKAVHDAPSILERFGRNKRAFISFYQSALAIRAKEDNLVYHGLAGHLFLKGVPHILKVRIIADLNDRVANEMRQEGISRKEAMDLISKDDQERRKWTQSLYGVDPWDSYLYDLVIHIHKFTIADAVDFICRTVELEQFKTTKESQQKMDDLALAGKIKAAFMEENIDVAVLSEYGNVLVYSKTDDGFSHKVEEKARNLQKEMIEIHNIEVHYGIKIPDIAV